MMIKINQANEILSDKEKREQYDALNEDNVYQKNNYYTDGNYNYSPDDIYKDKDNEKDNWLYDFLSRLFKFIANKTTNIENKKVSIKWQLLFALIPFVNLWAFYRIGRTFMSLAVLIPLFVGSFVLTIISGQIAQIILPVIFNGIALTFIMGKWSIEWNRHFDEHGFGGTVENIDFRWQIICSIIPFVNISAFARVEKFFESIALTIPVYIFAGIIHTIISFYSSHTNDNVSLLLAMALTSPIFIFFMLRWTKTYNIY